MNTKNRSLFLVLTSLIALIFSATPVTLASTTDTMVGQKRLINEDDQAEALLQGLKYNTCTGLYEYDVDAAVTQGADRTRAENFGKSFTELDANNVAALNEAIGFVPDFSGKIIIPVIPADKEGKIVLLAIGKWGAYKACENIQGRNDAFDGYCQEYQFTTNA